MDLNALYNELLGRGADTSGTAFYSGMGADQVRSALMASPEYQSRLQAQQMQASGPAATPGGANSNFYVPQSLLNSLGVTSAQAQSGQYTPASNPWQGYTPQQQAPASSSMDALRVALDVASGKPGNYAQGSWQSGVQAGVNGLSGTAYDGSKPYTGASHIVNGVQLVPGAAGYNAQAAAPYQQQAGQSLASYNGMTQGGSPAMGGATTPQASSTPNNMQSILDTLQNQWQQFQSGIGQTAQYGGVFGNQTSPTYSPQSKNGYGQGWSGSNPFKIGSF